MCFLPEFGSYANDRYYMRMIRSTVNAVTYSLLPTCTVYGLTENDGHEIDGHENDGHDIGGQDIYRLKIK